MGNYFEGTLEFHIRRDKPEFIDAVFNYARDTWGADYDKHQEYFKNHINIFTTGAKIWRSKYHGDIRDYRNIQLFAKAKEDNYDEYVGIDLGEIFYDLSEEGEYHGKYPEPYTFENVCDFWKNMPKYKDEIDGEVQLLITVYTNEKGYCGDSDIIKLIDLWSPYLENDYIGHIEDEDHTFCKDYFIFNNDKTEHFDFCGNWCKDYWPESSCVCEHCKILFDKGIASVVKENSTKMKENFTKKKILAAQRVLMDNGCGVDDTSVVMEALGAVLFDEDISKYIEYDDKKIPYKESIWE